jgi:hypothetical protein
MAEEDVLRRLDRLENEQDKMEMALQQLVLSTQRIGDLLESQKGCLPRIEKLTAELVTMKIELSNSQLIQRGVVWLGGIVASSAIIMALTFVFQKVT